MGTFRGFKFAIKSAKPFVSKHYGHARAGVSAEFKARKKGAGFQYDLHATVPADSVHRAKKHIKKYKLGYELAAGGVAGYAGARAGMHQQKKNKKR